jgi:hypothetical protein
MQSPFYLLVLEAIDDGVDHGSEDSVEDREGFLKQGDHVACWGYIDYNEGAIEHSNHTEVGGTGGEGFLSPMA